MGTGCSSCCYIPTRDWQPDAGRRSRFFIACVAAAFLGFAAGAELDLMAFLAAKYFGLLHYAKIYAILYAALALASGISPMLFATIFDVTGSYSIGFVFGACFFAAGALMVLALGKYPASATDTDTKEL